MENSKTDDAVVRIDAKRKETLTQSILACTLAFVKKGYWQSTLFVKEAKKEYDETGEIKFYDSNTGKLLFVAPKGRTFDDFIRESVSHGWPSFRDEEVNWDYVRCLKNGEAVSVDGTHLGHNLPDFSGSRYCINLVSVAGSPVEEAN